MTEKTFNVFALCVSLLTVASIAITGEPEEAIIRRAAARNNCIGDDYWILLAIRKAENGGKGKEFGVKGKAWNTCLDTQAGWAAATIMAHHKRQPLLSGKAFIDSLGDRYCPASCDPVGNVNWKKNVWHWYQKYREGAEQ